MNEIQITPSLQSKQEINSMLRNVTRDADKIREFISKEKNVLYREELTKLFTCTLRFAERYDGCDSNVMATVDFKKDAREVFSMVADQKRGGRKLMFVMLSSPTSGLEQHFCSWWPTIRGLDSSSMRLMESFLKKLSIDIAAEVEVGDVTTPAPTLSSKDTEEMVVKRLENDVVKVVKEKMATINRIEGFSITSSGDVNGFTIHVSLLRSNDDSGVGVNDAQVKEELPMPVIGHFPPKSESARGGKPRPTDAEGFWLDESSDEEDFVQVQANLTPRG